MHVSYRRVPCTVKTLVMETRGSLHCGMGEFEAMLCDTFLIQRREGESNQEDQGSCHRGFRHCGPSPSGSVCSRLLLLLVLRFLECS